MGNTKVKENTANFFNILGDVVKFNIVEVEGNEEETSVRKIEVTANRYRMLKLIETTAKKLADKIKPDLLSYWERYGRKSLQTHGEQPISGIAFIDKGKNESVKRTYHDDEIVSLLNAYNALVGEEAQVSQDSLFTDEITPAVALASTSINTQVPSMQEKMDWSKFLMANQ